MPHFQPDPLRQRLHDVEAEIRDRVLQVCKSPPPEDLDTGAMIRFEEELSIVTSAAKEAVSLRRRLRVENQHDAGPAGHRADHRPGRAESGESAPEQTL